MRALKIITGHVIYNPAYTYKFQLKTTNNLNTLQHSATPFIFTYLGSSRTKANVVSIRFSSYYTLLSWL